MLLKSTVSCWQRSITHLGGGGGGALSHAEFNSGERKSIGNETQILQKCVGHVGVWFPCGSNDLLITCASESRSGVVGVPNRSIIKSMLYWPYSRKLQCQPVQKKYMKTNHKLWRSQIQYQNIQLHDTRPFTHFIYWSNVYYQLSQLLLRRELHSCQSKQTTLTFQPITCRDIMRSPCVLTRFHFQNQKYCRKIVKLWSRCGRPHDQVINWTQAWNKELLHVFQDMSALVQNVQSS